MTSDNFLMDLLNEGSSNPQTTPAAAQRSAAPDSTADRVESLIAQLKASGTDITATYEDWLKVGFALAGEFGESGRSYFHAISSLYSGYDQAESDTKYTECLKSEKGRTDISTLFYLAKQQGVTLPKPERSTTPSPTAKVTKGQSDKNVPVSFSAEEPEGMPDLPRFPAEAYAHLPRLLKRAVATMAEPQDKDLVLIGSIVTLSAALLPLRTFYFGKTIYPNTYLFVPGPAGAGKGKLDFCFRLVKPIHAEKMERTEVAKEEYRKEYARFKRQKKGDDIDPPVKPPLQMLRIPANSSATIFSQVMADNGNLLIFETEGDTVVNAFDSDFANYSDSFRKAFAHESFGYLRRGDDGEHREIENPRLTTVLSGTPEQVRSLIKDAENGLLSRFMFYCINGTPQWLDGFGSGGQDAPLEETFDSLGQEFAAFVKILEQTPTVKFHLSIVQQEQFNDFFSREKERMQELNGDLYSASSHRLAWCFLRIAMVLTALRMMDSGRIKEDIECTDADFATTRAIIGTISAHNDYIFNVLNRERPEGIAVSDSYNAAVRNAILDALPLQFGTSHMQAVATQSGKHIRTIRRQITRAIEEGKVEHISHGEYRKVK